MPSPWSKNLTSQGTCPKRPPKGATSMRPEDRANAAVLRADMNDNALCARVAAAIRDAEREALERAAEVFAGWVAECYAEHGHVAVFEHKHMLIERIADAIRAKRKPRIRRIERKPF